MRRLFLGFKLLLFIGQFPFDSGKFLFHSYNEHADAPANIIEFYKPEDFYPVSKG